MKIKTFILAAAMIFAVTGTAANAEEYDKTFEFTASDGSTGTITVSDGEMTYDIDFYEPQSTDDFDGALLGNCGENEFYDYFNNNYGYDYNTESPYFTIAHSFRNEELEYPLICMYGEKYYIVDAEAEKVDFVGYECIIEEMGDPDDDGVIMEDVEITDDTESDFPDTGNRSYAAVAVTALALMITCRKKSQKELT